MPTILRKISVLVYQNNQTICKLKSNHLSFYTGFLSWTSFKSLDKHLKETEFACNSESHCSCGKGKSLKEYTFELLEKIGVPEPNKISLRIYR